MPFVSTSLNTWREDVGRRMLNLDFKPSSDDPFRAELAPLLDFDGVRAARLSHSSGLTFRDASMVKDGTDTVALVINSKSNIEIKHQNQRVVVRRGDATFLENFETGQVGSLDKVNYVSIILPRESIAVERQDRPKIIATRIDRTSSPLQLLRAYIAGLPSPEQVPLELHKVASRHVYDLVKLVVAELLIVPKSAVT